MCVAVCGCTGIGSSPSSPRIIVIDLTVVGSEVVVVDQRLGKKHLNRCVS